MKTDKLWEQYQHYTQTLTEHSRKLAFAGAAICWFFKTPEITFPPLINIALGFIVVFFFLDILHYFMGAVFLGGWTRHQEKVQWDKTQMLPDDLEKPAWVDLPAQILFAGKTLILMSAFLFIGAEFLSRT